MKPWIQVVAEYLGANQPLNGTWIQAIANALANLPDPITTEIVNTFADLPDPTTSNGKFVWVKTATGVSWIPSWAGGNYKSNGLYYSDGISWEIAPIPYQATLSEVNTGTNNDKFLTPLTFSTSDIVNNGIWTLDFMDGTLSVTLFAPKEFKINSITNINNSPITLIEVNGSTYTLGDTINIGDEIEITVDTASVINLNNTSI